MTAYSVMVLTPAAAEAVHVHAGNPCPETECNTCQEATDSCFDPAGRSCTDDGNVCTDDTVTGRDHVHILITMIPVMTASSVTVLICAAVEAALFIPETPARRRSATPARKQRTAALIR